MKKKKFSFLADEHTSSATLNSDAPGGRTRQRSTAKISPPKTGTGKERAGRKRTASRQVLCNERRRLEMQPLHPTGR